MSAVLRAVPRLTVWVPVYGPPVKASEALRLIYARDRLTGVVLKVGSELVAFDSSAGMVELAQMLVLRVMAASLTELSGHVARVSICT